MSLYQWDGSLNAFDRPIAFHRCFVKVAGDVAGAVFLSQLCYWAKRADPARGHWFYKSAVEWEEETSLSWEQQKRIRGILKKTRILEERDARVEHRIYFRLNWEPLLKVAGGVPDSRIRETLIAQSDKPGPPNQGNPDSFIATETTAENTTETTQASPSVKSSKNLKPAFSYSAFQSRYYSLTGTTPGKIPSLVTRYSELCTEHTEDSVLNCLSEWVDGQGGRKSLKGDKWGPNHFLDQVEIMLTTSEGGATEDKEKRYAHGLEKPDWTKDYETKFLEKKS